MDKTQGGSRVSSNTIALYTCLTASFIIYWMSLCERSKVKSERVDLKKLKLRNKLQLGINEAREVRQN